MDSLYLCKVYQEGEKFVAEPLLEQLNLMIKGERVFLVSVDEKPSSKSLLLFSFSDSVLVSPMLLPGESLERFNVLFDPNTEITYCSNFETAEIVKSLLNSGQRLSDF